MTNNWRLTTLAAISLTILWTASARAAVPEAWRKAWSDPAVQQRIDQGIEQNRKGDAVIELVGDDGKPIAGATITAAQQTHEFLFGCNLFVLGQLATPELNAKYEAAFTKLFNFASLPLYWEGTEPEQGALRYEVGSRPIWRRPPPDPLVAWCKAHDITPKGHPLVWFACNPEWLPQDSEALKQLYLKRMDEIAERYPADIPIWDVVNESIVCPKSFPLFTEDRSYVAWSFNEAHKRFPADNLLMINEVTEVSHQPIAKNLYYRQVADLLDQGVGVEGIGFQFHFFHPKSMWERFFKSPICRPANLLDVYDKFAEFKLPLFITEITISGAGDVGPDIQAEAAANLYRLWFSAAQMAGVTWWNLGDGTAYKSESTGLGGLLDENMDPKPAFHALDKLINHDWKTQASGKTDAEGRYTFRGFYGKYTVNVAVGDTVRQFEIELGKDHQGPFTLEVSP